MTTAELLVTAFEMVARCGIDATKAVSDREHICCFLEHLHDLCWMLILTESVVRIMGSSGGFSVGEKDGANLFG